MPTIDEYLTAQSSRFEEELCEFLRIASVSADPERRAEIQRAAAWVADQFRRLGFAAEIVPTAGHPLVYAESPPVAGAPTALVYGHYDVQPPDPLEKWISPPFEPVRREGNLVARGATDDKGQMLTHIKSAEAWIKTRGSLPINLKYIIEGEEEVGSQALEEFIAAHADRLACDCVVISDGGKFSADIPAITYGLRGIAYYELRAERPEPRPALGHVRRLGDQSGQRPGADPGRHDRPPRQGADSRFLRRRGAADRPRAPRDGGAALRRGGVFRRDRRLGGDRRRGLHRAGAALGPADLRHLRPVRAATRAPGRRPSCPPRRGPSSASAWSRTRTRPRSAPRCGRGWPGSARRA